MANRQAEHINSQSIKIPVVPAADVEDIAIKSKKGNARKEWLRILLRTRQKSTNVEFSINLFENPCIQRFKVHCVSNMNKRRNLVCIEQTRYIY